MSGQTSPAEDAALDRALQLARAGGLATWPNPCVGAVLLDASGAVCAEGRSEPAGGRHAEVVALQAAGRAARGGTAVVTLEPCDAAGRTGPCTQALLAAGIRRVVYAVADPVPPFAGGAGTLRAAGVEVLGGVGAARARSVHGPWLAASRDRPWVTVKVAATLDGRAAAADGTSRWITSPQARQDAHRLRAAVDAIAVGSGTVLADDPHLTARGVHPPARPLRVVLDRRGRVPAGARVLDGAAPSLHLTGPRGLPEVLGLLHAEHGTRHLLVEGGPQLAGAFLAADLVDELVAYLAPALLGAGPPAVCTGAFGTIDRARRLQLLDVTRTGPDLRLTAAPDPHPLED